MAHLLHRQNQQSDQPVEENLEKHNLDLSNEQSEMLWKSGLPLTSASRCACFEQVQKLKLHAKSANSIFAGGTLGESKWKRFSQQQGYLLK